MGTVDPNSSEIKDTCHPTIEPSTLKRREIQAPIIAGLLHGFIDEIGYDKGMDIAAAAIQKDASIAGKIMAEKYGGNSMKELVRVVKEAWAAENALGITVLEETDQRLSFDVTRCRYAELYERLGVKEFGYCLSCNRDAPFLEGFNPRMKLIRTQTIMQGATKCDFRIRIE
jgi:predicted hydrocarbon binding protein